MRKKFYIIGILLLFFSCCTCNKIKLNLSKEQECKIIQLSFKRFAEMNRDVSLKDIDKYCFDITIFDDREIHIYISPKAIMLGGDGKIIYDSDMNIISEQYGE